jgi:hypothetical protein
MKVFLIATLSFFAGVYAAEWTTFYRLNCDTQRFKAYQWESQRMLRQSGFQCLHSNHILELESDPLMLLQLIYLEVVYR